MISLALSVNAGLTGVYLGLTLHVSSKGNAFWTPRPALKVGSGSLPTVQPGSRVLSLGCPQQGIAAGYRSVGA